MGNVEIVYLVRKFKTVAISRKGATLQRTVFGFGKKKKGNDQGKAWRQREKRFSHDQPYGWMNGEKAASYRVKQEW